MQSSAVFHMLASLDRTDQNTAGEESVGFISSFTPLHFLKKTQLGFRSSPFHDNRPVSSTTARSRHPLRPEMVRWNSFICIRQNVSSARSVCRTASVAPLLVRAECSCELRGLGSAWKEEPNSGDARLYVEKHPYLKIPRSPLSIAFPHASLNEPPAALLSAQSESSTYRRSAPSVSLLSELLYTCPCLWLCVHDVSLLICVCMSVTRDSPRSPGQSFEGGLEAEHRPGHNHHLRLLLLLQVNQQPLSLNTCRGHKCRVGLE